MPADGQAQPAGPAWPVRSGLVPPLAEGFVGRPDTVPGLEAALVPGAAVALVPGPEAAGGSRGWPGSCGKTQLACYAAESLWRSRAVDLLAWVAAASRASVLSGFALAAAQLGLDHGGDAESVAARVVAWLGTTSRPWLVVFDDLCSGADLDGLWPAGPAGRLLVTTADPATVPGELGAVALQVSSFSSREALTYLSGRLITDPDQRSGAIDLATDLGGEPTALAQAAVVIISSGIRCREYRDYFLQRQAQAAAADGELPAAAGLTWTTAASRAEQLAPGAGTWRLLVLIALLDGHGIPASVFTAPAVRRFLAVQAAEDPSDPHQAWSVLLVLERAGLVTIDAAGAAPAVWVSSALQAAVRTVAAPELLEQAVRAAADALDEVWPTAQPRSWLVAALRSCAVSLREIAGDSLWAGGSCHPLLVRAGHSLDEARLTGPAAGWWRELAAGCDRILGPGHPDTLAVAGLLASALLTAGQAAEAVTWSEWVLAGRASVLGPGHRATIAAQVSLGRALAAAGKPGDAVVVLTEAVARSERAWGSGDAGSLAAREEYAAACLQAGQAAEAIRCYKRSLAGRERLHGPAHSGALAARLKLAGAYLAAGRAKDAIAQYRQVLAGREHALGADHPDTLSARAHLAAACEAAGQMGAALQLHEQTCAGSERMLGAGHPDTLARRADLARAYHIAGQLGDAVTVLREAIACSEQALSPGDPLTQALRETLADITGEVAAW
jgi:tetratricopeptide (TPR) repeat protein